MKKIMILLGTMLLCGQLFAQNVKRPESYNYQRGVEAVQKEQWKEAYEFFNKELKDNPKNGYAYSWITLLRWNDAEYGLALNAANMAIKYLPHKDVEYMRLSYRNRAKTYLCLEDTIKALADYAMAIKIDNQYENSYEERAQIYYELGKYDLADADYKKMIELKPGETMGYMGMGRNANAQERWEEAVKQFDYVTKLSKDYSQVYSFRAESFVGLEKWNEATDDIVKALSLDWDKKAIHLAASLKEPAFTMLISKMKVQSVKSPNEAMWPYVIAIVYEQNNQYQKAIEYYTEANKRNVSPVTHNRIARCYFKVGNYETALENVNKAINMDSTDVSFIIQRADILYESGDVKSAIAEWDNVLAKDPEYGFGYYRRGWFKTLSGNDDGAIEDLSMCVVLEPDYSFAIETRGDIYLRQGKKELAEADFKKVIELENTPEKYNCIHYAYQGLGMYNEARAAMDSIIARDSTDYGNYYDAACLYSRMKDKENALKFLEKALALGYNRFAHIERDFDMDFLRDTKEFKALISKYKEKANAVIRNDVSNDSTQQKTGSVEVPFTKENGVCKVKCNINGLPLHFVFDTGASDVSLSMVEANFMVKNGYLTKKDVIGSQQYLDANGDISVGTVVNIKEVDFGGLKLNNVRASVVRNQKAPLLLGQSVLGRLGKVEIDNSKNVLKISHGK